MDKRNGIEKFNGPSNGEFHGVQGLTKKRWSMAK